MRLSPVVASVLTLMIGVIGSQDIARTDDTVATDKELLPEPLRQKDSQRSRPGLIERLASLLLGGIRNVQQQDPHGGLLPSLDMGVNGLLGEVLNGRDAPSGILPNLDRLLNGQIPKRWRAPFD